MRVLLAASVLLLVSCDKEPQDMNPKLPGTHKGSSIGGDGQKAPNKVDDVNRNSESW
ncbi:hypothetical protein [Roseimicrobium sp. ORNL1]|uniref:hypothetical protein n=1 Tax=Roseimicrobium sp. ORNL1 TaxID=2711231 RepID=UPI001981B192|nr:hypothetical protein [Roseimicrobium sp. ORNL1]